MNKFYRSNEKYVGGVCGGLGNYTGIDPIVWRLAFLFIPSAFWIYIAMWAFTENK
jgi:phage shock protein PspC (stress-responsive transcriptional regulator)